MRAMRVIFIIVCGLASIVSTWTCVSIWFGNHHTPGQDPVIILLCGLILTPFAAAVGAVIGVAAWRSCRNKAGGTNIRWRGTRYSLIRPRATIA